MDNTTLVNMDVQYGSQVLNALDKDDLQIKVALLMSSSDYEDWRFVIASRILDKAEPLKAYEKVVKILRRDFMSHNRLPTVLILRMTDPFIKELRERFSGTDSAEGMRLGGQTFGNRFIHDAYVYRIK